MIGDCPPASCGSRSPSMPAARSWSTTVPAAPCARGPIAAARRRRRGRRPLRRRRRSRARRPRPQGLRQGTRARRRQTCSRPSPDAALPIFPMASSTRSSTATTSSCSRSPAALATTYPSSGASGRLLRCRLCTLHRHRPLACVVEPASAVGHDVIHLALLGGHVASRRVRAMPITNLDGPPQRAGEEPLPHADVDHS